MASFNVKNLMRHAVRDDPRVDPNLLRTLKAGGVDIPGPALPLDSRSPDEAKSQLMKVVESSMQLALNSTVSQLKPIETVSSRTIALYVHTPIRANSNTGPLPCIYHTHGGAMAVLQVLFSLFSLFENLLLIHWCDARDQMITMFDGGWS